MHSLNQSDNQILPQSIRVFGCTQSYSIQLTSKWCVFDALKEVDVREFEEGSVCVCGKTRISSDTRCVN